MQRNHLQENEIIVQAFAVKYHCIEYFDGYIVPTQNRTRRRIYNGWFFEDTGTHIYISSFYAHIFQHKKKVKQFIVNVETKDWTEYQDTIVERHKPEKVEPINMDPHADLIR